MQNPFEIAISVQFEVQNFQVCQHEAVGCPVGFCTKSTIETGLLFVMFNGAHILQFLVLPCFIRTHAMNANSKIDWDAGCCEREMGVDTSPEESRKPSPRFL